MKRLIATILLFLPQVLHAQDAPRALPVDPRLEADPAKDFFDRCRNVYDTALRIQDAEQKILLFNRSIEIFSIYINDFPNHPNIEPAWWYLGNSYLQLGQTDEANRIFNILLNRYPTGQWSAAAAYTLGANHYAARQYALAAPLFERYAANVAKPEEQPRGYFFAANSHRMTGRDREATRAYRKIIEHPDGGDYIPQSRIALGHLAVKNRNDEDALKVFEEVAADTKVAARFRGEAALNASLAATRLKRTDVADTYLKMILQADGMRDFHADAQTALMNNQYAAGRYEAVLETFKKASLKAEGEREASRLMIAARAMMRLKKFSDALGHFREIERLVPPENELAYRASYYRLLCFYQIEGRYLLDQVDAFLELYQNAKPDDAMIHTALMMKAETHYKNGQLAEAARVYALVDHSKLNDANRPGLFFQGGWCLSEAGDHAGAIRLLDGFIENHPQDSRIASALARRAKSHAATGNYARAREDFDRIIAAADDEKLVSFAWLEAARMHRAGGEIPEMVERYQGFLNHVEAKDEKLLAEANYWIGWGMVRSGTSKDAIGYLEKSRELRPDAYAKHAGLLLALSYFSSQNADALSREIDAAIEGNYADDLPEQAIRWAGMQMFNERRYDLTARFLAWISDDDEPRQTPKEVWRYLGKAHIETGAMELALEAIQHVLDVEDQAAWIADGLLDRGRALLALNRHDEARGAAEKAIALNPQGRTSAMLRILMGELENHAGNPKRAAAEFLVVVQFHQDAELKPLALHLLTEALSASGDAEEAGKFKSQLANEFPDWKAP